MAARGSSCLRRLSGGQRRLIVGFGRFLGNPRVTVEKLIEGWGAQAALACAGRHVLAVQDTSEIRFCGDNRRGLGEIGHGGKHGVLLHAMLALDAQTGGVLGLVAGDVWTRQGRVQTPHTARPLTEKESLRWVETAEAAKDVLAHAAMVTEVSDREGDFYAKWARLPGKNLHILTRAMQDRVIAEGGGRLSSAPLQLAGSLEADIQARPHPDGRPRELAGSPARKAQLEVRFAQVSLKRPGHTIEKNLPQTVAVSLVEVREVNAPKDAEPVLWRLLTTHAVTDAAMAFQIIAWYRMRWTIEQFFRTLKQQGLQLEDSQVESAGRLVKLTAVAARAAVIIMQLVQARDGNTDQRAALSFTHDEIKAMKALVPELEGKTALQKNPHPPESLAWAAWVIAKLGGWDGYPKSSPPGPITFKHGLKYFKALAHGARLKDV
jgi:hypothetical protein